MTDSQQTQRLQAGDRVRVRRHILPIRNRCADTSVKAGTEGYIKFKDHINDVWCVVFDGWLARLIATADLERIVPDQREQGGDR